jgi:hypothetical protein
MLSFLELADKEQCRKNNTRNNLAGLVLKELYNFGIYKSIDMRPLALFPFSYGCNLDK